MQFTKRLREPIRNGEITQSVRIWKSPRVKAGNAYRLAPGWIVVESIYQIEFADITARLARETGFSSLAELLKTARHGAGEKVYLVTFHYTEALEE
ncbi:MAG: ASCH domain-containing protein [bacterium]